MSPYSREHALFPFPSGGLHMRGSGTNTADGTRLVADRNHALNTADKLKFILIDQATIGYWSLPTAEGGYRYSVIRPTAPYAPHGLMLAVFPENSYQQIGEKTQFVYDYPEAVQQQYWQMILSGLAAYSKCQEHSPLYVENVTLTSNDHRTSRTLNPVHGQFVALDESLLGATTGEIDHLIWESQITAALIQRVRSPIEKILDEMPSLAAFGITAQFFSTPAGYGFSFPLEEKSVAEQMQLVMAEHWQAYATYCQRERDTVARRAQHRVDEPTKPKTTIPGPSYRQYVWVGDGCVQVVISPEYCSHAGVLEAMGVQLHRSAEGCSVPEDERVQKEAEIMMFWKEIVGKMRGQFSP
jgi:hypothetical protein